jgi:hypothetical protein
MKDQGKIGMLNPLTKKPLTPALPTSDDGSMQNALRALAGAGEIPRRKKADDTWEDAVRPKAGEPWCESQGID